MGKILVASMIKTENLNHATFFHSCWVSKCFMKLNLMQVVDWIYFLHYLYCQLLNIHNNYKVPINDKQPLQNVEFVFTSVKYDAREYQVKPR